ncbi:MAG: beta-eliminating lyase-related protein, partial [Phycisphaerae bacterium]|nr:beta-eliminating lyase-related protein [Phycisphaerae bacterium]
VARQHGLKSHLDGARLWNAVVATGVPEHAYAARFDSVSVCFSKGLGAPVGSALAGDADFITQARRHRKQFGGGMRQAGLIAAGALYAVEHNRTRLSEDHQNAQKLARGLAEIDGVEIDPDRVETNIVRFETPGIAAAEVARQLEDHGVRLLDIAPNTIRAVTNLMVQASDIPVAIQAVRQVVTDLASTVA